MKLSTQPYKGMRDFYPDDMRLRNYIFYAWRKVCISFGYEEYDGPVLEPLELYASKTSEEIVNEQTYSFTDRGDRKVVMRPEMTPTVSRMVAARRQELGYPLRLFSIPNCFRYERTQRGRTREFWQLNADLFGVESIDAEIEMLLLADRLMTIFGAERNMYQIRLNSRKLLNSQIEKAQPKESAQNVLRLIDRRDKMSQDDFTAKLNDAVGDVTGLTEFLDSTDIETIDDPAADGLKSLLKKAAQDGIVNAIFVPSVARGFDYYTDIVFEVFDMSPENNRAMFGGGRYDGLVAEFGVESVPTIGIAPGDVTMANFLESWKLLPDSVVETDIYIATIGEILDGAQAVAQQLRAQGLNVAVDLSDRKLDKQIKTAEKKGVKNVLFIGEQELETKQFKLKNLKSGKETECTLAEIPDMLAS